jgi:hypothetical protein
MNHTLNNQTELCNDIAKNLARHLIANQVIAQDFKLDFGQSETLALEIKLFNKSEKSIPLNIKVVNGNQFVVTTGMAKIKVPLGQFWRITESGTLSTIPDFFGLKPSHKGIKLPNVVHPSVDKVKPTKAIIVAGLKKLPWVLSLLKTCRDYFFPEPHQDLSMSEGVTFRLCQHPEQENTFVCESYDEGGIFDEYINAEGLSYPHQVAGNYYADAYSCLVFERMFRLTHDDKWLKASLASQRFTQRVYPQYMPASIVWHHSDFKNAAIVEEQLASQSIPGVIQPWSIDTFYEDRYEPTNVFALRYHWKSVLAKLTNDDKLLQSANKDLEKVACDQTDDGLFHDNIATYPDAHDLTYHQYSTACLGLGLLQTEDPKGWDMFNRAVRFTLNALSPSGEPAYTGRASNNIHQSASAILAFSIAASRSSKIDEIDMFLKGISVMAVRLKSFQLDSGMLPTAMNTYVDKRMAWNHCETPYNGLVGYMLLRAASILEQLTESENSTLLPLEQEHTWLANDAGFASLGNGHQYLVFFAGCDRSYGWSEDRHVTGCAGLALFGDVNGNSLLPCLDVSIPDEVVISDMPIINGQAAFGRGHLSQESDSIKYSHSYGGADVIRLYSLINNDLVIVSRIKSLGKPLQIQGGMAWAGLHQKHFELNVDKAHSMLTIKNGDNHLCAKVWHFRNNNFGGVQQSQKVSNAKGMATRYDFGCGIVKAELLSVLVLSKPDKIHNYRVTDDKKGIQIDLAELSRHFDLF